PSLPPRPPPPSPTRRPSDLGPRSLHSTGQLHKGGPNSAVCLQIVGEDRDDLPIPNQPYTFGALKHAQALGDLGSLQAHGRRAARDRKSTRLNSSHVAISYAV